MVDFLSDRDLEENLANSLGLRSGQKSILTVRGESIDGLGLRGFIDQTAPCA